MGVDVDPAAVGDSARGRACRTRRAPPSGAPADLLAADRRAPARRAPCGPSSRSACGSAAPRGRSRRGTTPAARRRRPTRSGPSAPASSTLRLRVPSLKPMRLRGVTWSLVVFVLLPKPSCIQRSSTAPRPARSRLRTAWKATCGSSAQAWMHRSPPLRGGVELVAGQRPERLQARGPPAAQAHAVLAALLEHARGRAPKVIVSRDGRQPHGLAGVARRDLGLAGHVARRAARRSSARAPAVHDAQQLAAGRARRRTTRSKAPKTSRACAGVAMPAWWAPWNGTISRRRRRRRRRRRSRRRRSRRPRRRASPRAPPPPSSTPAARQPALRLESPCLASLLVGQRPSPRRATAARPARRSAGRTGGGPAA